MTFIFLDFFALYTNSFARSFASSISIAGSSLVIRHNQARNVANQKKNRVSACTAERKFPVFLGGAQKKNRARAIIKNRRIFCLHEVGSG